MSEAIGAPPIPPLPRYTPTLDDQFRVRELAAIGLSDDDIVSQLRLPLRRLQKRFRLELKEGGHHARFHLQTGALQ